MTESQTAISLETLIAYPLMIIICLYMTASVFVPFLNVHPPIFTVVFTLSGGIPAVTLFLKERFSKYERITSDQ